MQCLDGRRLFGMMKVGEIWQVVISKAARDLSGIKPVSVGFRGRKTTKKGVTLFFALTTNSRNGTIEI